MYNGYNRVSQVQIGNEIAQYTYNAEGLRTRKDVEGKVTNFAWQHGNIALETDADGRITAINTHAGSRILFRETDSGILSYVTDGHGDVTKILNAKGDIIKDYSYDPYGMALQQNQANRGRMQFSSPTTMTGIERDLEELMHAENPLAYDGMTALWDVEADGIDNPFRYCGEYQIGRAHV